MEVGTSLGVGVGRGLGVEVGTSLGVGVGTGLGVGVWNRMYGCTGAAERRVGTGVATVAVVGAVATILVGLGAGTGVTLGGAAAIGGPSELPPKAKWATAVTTHVTAITPKRPTTTLSIGIRRFSRTGV